MMHESTEAHFLQRSTDKLMHACQVRKQSHTMLTSLPGVAVSPSTCNKSETRLGCSGVLWLAASFIYIMGTETEGQVTGVLADPQLQQQCKSDKSSGTTITVHLCTCRLQWQQQIIYIMSVPTGYCGICTTVIGTGMKL